MRYSSYTMRDLIVTKRFKKGDKKMRKRGCNFDKLDTILEILAKKGVLPSKYKSHRLSGEWSPAYECHIEHDWLLIYTMDGKTITLYATGTHDDLFS